MTEIDVVVVGAGPAGSATAAGLARGGARVLLVEAAHHPRPKACAEYASPRLTEELARIGLPPAAWMDLAVPLAGMEMHAGRRVARVGYADARGPRSAWGVDRRTFDARLAEHASACGADVREGVRAVALAWDADRVVGVRLRDGTGQVTRVRSGHVIGADGSRSMTARLAGVERPVRFPRRLGLVAHHSGVEALDDHGEMHVGDGYYVGLAPTPGGELNVGMALPMDGAGTARERFEAAIAGIPAVASRLAGGSRLSS
ncbi:MAG TPA: NAD(P)/FAD-dependent oxidoreductase, partial [Candidatus Limnocylindria bacterium]